MTHVAGRDSPASEENDKFSFFQKPRVRVFWLIAFCVVCLVGAGLGTRYYLHQSLNLLHAVLSLFLSVNVLICYWEVCLYLQRDRIEKRTVYWRNWQIETGRLPHVEFVMSKIPWTRVLSPALWSDIWSTYAQYDPSYADRRTYGFNADIANGFFTFLPSLLLYVALTVHFLPSPVVGILGVILFWQWVYMTSVYVVGFFVAKHHANISRRDLFVYVFGFNGFWILCPMLGLFVSIRLIVDGNYAVLGS